MTTALSQEAAHRTSGSCGSVPAPSHAVPRGWFVGAPKGARAGRGPIAMGEVELCAAMTDLTVPSFASRADFVGVHLLVSMHRQPIGIVLVPSDWFNPDGRIRAPELLAATVKSELWTEVVDHLREDGLAIPSELGPAGLSVVANPPCSWASRLGSARPSVTVCIATCGGDPAPLLRTIRSALAQTYDNFQVLVVDNRPGSSGLPGPLVDEFFDDDRLFYVTEPQPGLGTVRNRGIREAEGEIVALTDDDVALSSDWLGSLVAAFDVPEVACVTGLILPDELVTGPELLIEEFGGFSKGFRRRRWDLDGNRLDHPLYPYILGMYGSGANAAWRRSAIEAIGGYDDYLGTGTKARGGEDLDIYLECVLRGHQLVYEPAALIRHEHHRDLRALRRQIFDYGAGLGAVLTKRLLHEQERRDLLPRLGAGLEYLLNPRSPKNRGKSTTYPRSLTAAELAGIAYGPVAYLRSRARR